MQVGKGIHRIGGNSIINAYLLEDGGEVTIVDAGLPGYWRDLPAELASMGRTIEDVRALLLTHGHSDHIGFAERIRRDRGVPIHVLEADAALARGQAKNPSKGSGPIRVGPLLRYMDALQSLHPNRPIVVVLAEVGPRHWWENLLHNQTSLRLKLRLFGRKNTIVADVPFHLDD